MPVAHYDYDFIDESIKSYFFKTNAHVFYRIEFKPIKGIFVKLMLQLLTLFKMYITLTL